MREKETSQASMPIHLPLCQRGHPPGYLDCGSCMDQLYYIIKVRSQTHPDPVGENLHVNGAQVIPIHMLDPYLLPSTRVRKETKVIC